MAEPALSSVRLYRMETPEHACPWGRRALQLLRAEGIPFEALVRALQRWLISAVTGL